MFADFVKRSIDGMRGRNGNGFRRGRGLYSRRGDNGYYHSNVSLPMTTINLNKRRGTANLGSGSNSTKREQFCIISILFISIFCLNSLLSKKQPSMLSSMPLPERRGGWGTTPSSSDDDMNVNANANANANVNVNVNTNKNASASATRTTSNTNNYDHLFKHFGSSAFNIQSYTPLGGNRFTEYKNGHTPPYLFLQYSNVGISTNNLSNLKRTSDKLAQKRQPHIRNAMKHAWAGYTKYAYGYDEIQPLSQNGRDNFGGIAATLIDSLDTLWIMDMKDEFYSAQRWLEGEGKDKMFDRDVFVSVFETTIRGLGGLLAAYDVSHETVFLERAEDLGRRLLRSFGDDSDDGSFQQTLPFKSVNLKTGATMNDPQLNCDYIQDSIQNPRVHPPPSKQKYSKNYNNKMKNSHNYHQPNSKHDINHNVQKNQSPCTYIAEAGTMQIEFRYLAQVTGNKKYKDLVEKAFDKIQTLESKSYGNNGLYPNRIQGNAQDGTVEYGSSRNFDYTFGGTADSFYEYMLKMWLQGNKKEDKYRNMYDRAIDAMHTHLLKKGVDGLLVIGSMKGTKKQHTKNMEHLTCFMGGVLALGAYTDPDGIESERAQRDLKTARAVTYTCYQMYARMPTGLSPEAVDANHKFAPSANSAHYLLRPETVESFYILHELTGDPIYREWGWEIFQSIEKYCKTNTAYSKYRDVRYADSKNSRQENSMESFFLAETLKYLYLLFETNSNIDILNKHVFNTEAHPLHIFTD